MNLLDGDHAQSEKKIRNVEQAPLAVEMLGSPRQEEFERAVAQYVDFYLNHMALEERGMLPLAERVLTDADRRDLDEAFAQKPDSPIRQVAESECNALVAQGAVACNRGNVMAVRGEAYRRALPW